jgi:hypothetical protein
MKSGAAGNCAPEAFSSEVGIVSREEKRVKTRI